MRPRSAAAVVVAAAAEVTVTAEGKVASETVMQNFVEKRIVGLKNAVEFSKSRRLPEENKFHEGSEEVDAFVQADLCDSPDGVRVAQQRFGRFVQDEREFNVAAILEKFHTDLFLIFERYARNDVIGVRSSGGGGCGCGGRSVDAGVEVQEKIFRGKDLRCQQSVGDGLLIQMRENSGDGVHQALPTTDNALLIDRSRTVRASATASAAAAVARRKRDLIRTEGFVVAIGLIIASIIIIGVVIHFFFFETRTRIFFLKKKIICCVLVISRKAHFSKKNTKRREQFGYFSPHQNINRFFFFFF